MAELPDKLLGIDIDETDDRRGSTDLDRAEPEEHVRVVLFALGDHRLAVPVDDVRTTTRLHEAVTAVPRVPAAVEGVVDLRGEITAVIDPSVHFPPATVDDDSDQLLVLDQSTDQQSTALRVDDVVRVESIPERCLVDEDGIEDSEFSGDVLEHPLVEALLEYERTPRSAHRSEEISPDPIDGQPTELSADAPGTDSRDLEGDGGDAGTVDRSLDRIVVEGIPLIDVEKLLLAAGPRGDALALH